VFKHAVDFARDPFEFVDRATSECGDIYRMDLPAVDDVFVLAHPDYFNRVLVADVDAFGKTEDYRRAFGNGLLSVEDQQWRRQREMMQPLFYREQIKGYTEQMVACTERRLEQWEAGDTRDMETEMRDLTLEILFATLFGRELVPGEDQELRDAADGLNEWFTPPRGFSPLASDTSSPSVRPLKGAASTGSSEPPCGGGQSVGQPISRGRWSCWRRSTEA